MAPWLHQVSKVSQLLWAFRRLLRTKKDSSQASQVPRSIFRYALSSITPESPSIYNTILLKDIVARHSIRQVALLERIAFFLFDNIGQVVSANRIATYLKSQRLKVGVDTVVNYLRYFQDALIAHKASRFDIKGHKLLEVHEKYYLGDVGLRHAFLGFREGDISQLLENVVYLELLRRGYGVTIGKLADREVDFIATREGKKIYIQVSYLLASNKTIEREFSPLLAIADNYPKLVLSMDPIFGDDYKGIKRIHLVDFLLAEESLSYT